MQLTVKLDFGCGREIKVGTFSEIGRDTAFEFAGEFLSSGLDPAPFRLRAGGGLKIYDRSGNMETFGIFDDSLPDGWGRRIVDRMFMKREGRLPTVTERLMCVGRSGKGALVYEPADEAAQAANEAFDLAALAEEAMAFGQRLGLIILHTIRQTKEYLSIYHLLQQLGILLRVIAAATVGRCTMSAASATIGRFLLTTTAHTSWNSSTMAMSIRRPAAIGRTAFQSVASKKVPEEDIAMIKNSLS